MDTSRIFNKSFNDLSILQNGISENTIMKPQFIFVFDFDLTLTLKNASDIYMNSNYIELFESEKKLLKLKELFKKINDLGSVIYINTRALASDINHILTSVGINQLIKEVMGSKNIENINKPFSYFELDKYKLLEIKNIDILWAIKKVTFLNQIKENEQVDNNNILFFDDIPLNINTAKLNGYNNSFLIGSSDSGLYGLDYLLVKLEQIMEVCFSYI